MAIQFPSDIRGPLVSNASDEFLRPVQVVETQRGKPRLEFRGSESPLVKNLTWRLNRNDMAKLYRFWKETLREGFYTFEIELEGPHEFPEPYECRLLPTGFNQSPVGRSVFSEVTLTAIVEGSKRALVSFLYPNYLDEDPCVTGIRFDKLGGLAANEEQSSSSIACSEIVLDPLVIVHNVFDPEQADSMIECSEIDLQNVLIVHNVFDPEQADSMIECSEIELKDVLIVHNVFDDEQIDGAISCTEILLI